MDISIIIPVYNAEKYVERCAKSVLAAVKTAGLRSEILLIDNNSSDSSLLKIQKLAEKYPKLIHVLKCPTPGASAVRNFGAREARGKYIWFIDADDAISKSSINLLFMTAEREEADLTMLGAERIYPGGHRDYLSAVTPEEPDYISRFIRYGAGPWQFLIRRSWWELNDFSFHEGIIHEDMELISALILYVDKYAAVNDPLYYYYQNDESVLHKQEFNAHIFDIFPALEGLYARFRKAGVISRYRDELEWFFIWNLLIDSAKDFAKFPEGRVGFARARVTLKKYFPDWRKNRFLAEKPLRLRIRVRLNYYK